MRGNSCSLKDDEDDDGPTTAPSAAASNASLPVELSEPPAVLASRAACTAAEWLSLRSAEVELARLVRRFSRACTRLPVGLLLVLVLLPLPPLLLLLLLLLLPLPLRARQAAGRIRRRHAAALDQRGMNATIIA